MAENTTIKYVSPERLGYYDEKIKAYLEAKDAAVQSALEGQIDIVAQAITAEENRAKLAEQANATAASNAQTAADNAQTAADNAQAHSEALAAKVGTVEDGKTVMGIIAQIQENAYDDTEIRGLISGLDANKADKTQVATDIENAVKAEEEARIEAVNGVQGAVDALAGTVAGNKTAIEGTVSTLEQKVDANETDIEGKMTALTERVAANETAVGTTLPKAISDEQARAEEAEEELSGRLEEVEAFFKLAEGEQLDTALDTLVEIQGYLEGEGEVADQMLLDIAANKKAIEDHVATNHDFAAADATLKDELTVEINKKADATTVSDMDTAYKAADDAIKGRLDVLEAIDHEAYVAADTALKNELNGEIAKKADTTTVDGINGRVGTIETSLAEGGATANAIAEAKKTGTDAQAEVDALELVVGTPDEGKTVVGMIDALEEGAVATNASNITNLQGRVEELEAVQHEEITTDMIDAMFAQA